MLVPLKWLKDYVDIKDIEIEELRDKLIMSGSNIEAIEELGKEIENVIVGKILAIENHPNAENLIVAKVDVGTESIQIVTGAKNIKVGQYIPVVLPGGHLPGGIKIKKSKLRGIESNGMMCSSGELGIPDKVLPAHQDKNGIYILEQDYLPGTDIKKVLGINDFVIEFEITPNRSDCLSMLGMARETSATLNLSTQYPQIEIQQEHGDIEDFMTVEVQNPESCKRYVARAVTDVKIKPSPQWLQTRLMEAGIRPINNIVDITNYVMLEFGQPLHAFDLSRLAHNKIIVKNAESEKVFTTLDEVERKLDPQMLMIYDDEKPIALAGIMGGENSEVTEDTHMILLESANFNKDVVRGTSKKLALRTEASARFEKGVDPNICVMAANRACQLIEKLGAGRIVKGVIDIYPVKAEKKVVEARPDKINTLLGTNLTKEKMIEILQCLEMKIKEKENKILVEVPTFRQDIEEEVDLVEEVARIYGFDKIGMTIPKGNVQGAKTNGELIEDYTKNVLNALGLNEIQTYSFTSPKTLDLLCISPFSFMRNTVKLINPLGEENSIMRTTMMANMLEILAKNYNRSVQTAKAFELGRVFIPYSIPVNRLPLEKKMIVIGMYGKDIDFYMLKGCIEELFKRLGIFNSKYLPEKQHPTFHPGRCANILYGNHILGTFGEVHPDIAENFNMHTRTYLGELDFDAMMQIARLDKVYKPLPKYPSITRDIALVVKDEIYAEEIEDIIKEKGEDILESIELFDIYKGKQIPKGYKSIAYSLIYRGKDRTLTDEEVSTVHHHIIETLKEQLDAKLRE